MYTRKAAKTSIFKFFSEEEISGVVVKSGRSRAQAESVWNAVGQRDCPIREAHPWNLIGPSLSNFGSEASKNVPEFCRRSFPWMRNKTKKFLSDYGTQKALRVLIVQSPRTINLFQLIKLLNHGICLFCIFSVDWRSSKTERHLLHRTLNGCPTETGK